jgi:hypothetical protein
MRVLLFAIAMLAACGDDPDETCKPEGFSDGEGIVAGAPLGPFARAALITPDPRPFGGVAWALELDEGDGECGEPGPGRRISLLFCDTPKAQTYDIMLGSAFRCPTEMPKIVGLLEDEHGMDLAEAIGGSVTVTYAGGCVAGTYELQLGNDQISGSFDAVVCPTK